MYNRYIPRPDGSYARNRMQDAQPQSPPPKAPPPPPEPCAPPEPTPVRHKAQPSNGFLKQLLPANFDTGDLIVILLLLLMAGDSQEDKNTAILTLALYFLM